MLENLVAWVLNTYVGEYLENLNTDQLSIALLQGQVELENVPLKKTALRKFDIPVQVKSGLLGKLTLSIPLTRIRSEPWVLKMSDLLILLEPTTCSRHDVETMEVYEQTKKEQQLEELEKYHKKQLLAAAGLSLREETVQQTWWGASLFSSVLNNIQVILTNVHIRYEDETTLPSGVPFCCGIRIHNVSVQTTDFQWRVEYMQPREGVNAFKKLELKGLSVYWNCNQPTTKSMTSPKDLQDALAPETGKGNTFILQPFSAYLFMEKNTSKFPLKSSPPVPRFKFDFRPQKVVIELSNTQIAEMRLLAMEWARHDRGRQHRKWRPQAAVSENPKSWWLFAYNRVLDETHQRNMRRTWKFASTRVKHLNAYCRSYRRKLLSYLDTVAQKVAVEDVRRARGNQSSYNISSSSSQHEIVGLPSQRSSASVDSLVALSDGDGHHSKSEDIILMRQIERDAECSYHELQLFRETVFQRLLAERAAERLPNESGIQSEDETFEQLDYSASRRPYDTDTQSELGRVEKSSGTVTAASQSSGGIYGWFQSWFSGAPLSDVSENDDKKQGDENVFELSAEDSKYLKKLEKQLEDEILDALNESWDDSTILRRDVLLAEIALRLDQMTVRFIDDKNIYADNCTRILAMDLKRVISRVQLSLRQNSTAISLSVGDMTVQRLCITSGGSPTDNPTSSADGLVRGSESLIFGAIGVEETSHILFAIGKGKSRGDVGEVVSSYDTANCDLVQKPLFRMTYSRRAPKLVARHTLNAEFSELSVMYDEGAFDDIANIFATENFMFEEKNVSITELVQPSELFMTIHIPQVGIELRSKRSGLLNGERNFDAGAPFAYAIVKRVTIGAVNTDQYLKKVKVSFGEFDVLDLFEKTGGSLIRTIPQPSISQMKSSSCPNIALSCAEESFPLAHANSLETLNSSSSFPRFEPDVSAPKLSSAFANPLPTSRQKTEYSTVDNVTTAHSIVELTFMDSRHPLFKKANCIVDARLLGISVGMNRRSWIMLFDFFGFLGRGRDEAATSMDFKAASTEDALVSSLKDAEILASETSDKKGTFGIMVNATVPLLRINMNYPANRTQMGVLTVRDVGLTAELVLGDDAEPLTLGLSCSALSLTDATRFYSRLYSERLSVLPNLDVSDAQGRELSGDRRSPKIKLDMIKFFPPDPNLERPWDLHLALHVPSTMSVAYVHTHRYICVLLDFWMQFFELQDQVIKSNMHPDDIVLSNHGTRAELDVSIDCHTSLILPLNQFCEQTIIWLSDSFQLSNKFEFVDAVNEFKVYCIGNFFEEGDDINCLLDWISVNCSGISVYEGLRVAKDANVAHPAGWTDACQNMFDTYYFIRSPESVLSSPYDLHIDVFRNLDGPLSHKAPDMAITTEFSHLGISFTTDFYRLLRGFLEKNLGDQLVPIPETIPLEILQKPVLGCEIGLSTKYATFSFRMVFNDVQFSFLVPSIKPSVFEPFGLSRLSSAHISFDVFIDNQAELDFVCENSELYDIRYQEFEFDRQPNVFSLVACPRTKDDENERLMMEAHVMLKKDEAPVVTLVIVNARILLIFDWLNNFKDFILLSSDFTPPAEDTSSGLNAYGKSGVMHRVLQLCDSVGVVEQTITLKVTLQESDLIMLEDPMRDDSLALVAHTYAVLNLSDPHGQLSVNLEMQKMNIGWCLMSAEKESRCELTNNFVSSVRVFMEPEATSGETSTSILPGLPGLHIPKHRVTCDVNNIIARISYRDALVIRNVLQSCATRFFDSFKTSVIPKNNSDMKGGLELNIVHFVMKSDQISLWLLDDFQGNAFPLLRLVLTKLALDQYLDKVNGYFIAAVDYFNQRVFGWEPLIEPWHIEQLSAHVKNRSLSIELHTEESSTLDVNVTQVFLQQAVQFNSQWLEMKQSLDSDFRNTCTSSRSDHLPYLLRNETGSDLRFATAVEDVLTARAAQRKSTARWYSVAAGAIYTFEFPTKRLVAMGFPDEPRQLIIRVDGWDETSPVSVDSVGTCFRLARCSTSRHSPRTVGSANARLVIDVSMNKDGRKVVTIRSALTIVNQLSDSVLINLDSNQSLLGGYEIMRLEPGQIFRVPLKFSGAQLSVKPDGRDVVRALHVDWKEVVKAGETMNRILHFETKLRSVDYWVCVSVKRELYPEYEMLPGHTITLLPPLSVLNLLPIDAEFIVSSDVYAVGAGQQLHINATDITRDIVFRVQTDRFNASKDVYISSSILAQKPSVLEAHRLDIKMVDGAGSFLDMYGSVSVARSGAVTLSLWVPYWIVNKSGIPLILRQEGAESIAAGQLEEHERARDRNPLMFSFADVNCPNRCSVRVGKCYVKDRGYRPSFSEKFSLSPGLQSLKLLLTHEQRQTLIYNIGVEVRQGTGRYKDTQVVLLTPRYQLNNQSSFELLLSHVDDIDNPSQHVRMASNCNLIWNEKFEDKQMLCIKRTDVKYWSCPFPIDKINSFHVTMRDSEYTPHFVRVEVFLNSAVFSVTFTDAKYFPPPIQLINMSDVPVLYHQRTERSEKSHLRTICKARSTVDYAWDDHYGKKQLTLQVFENKSNTYDPQTPGIGPSLVYDNDVYIKFASSFSRSSSDGFTDEHELVLEVMQKGKVMLNKRNLRDSSRSQLWRFASDGCLENIGMSMRAKSGERYVLDVLDLGGNKLMMLKRNTARDQFQKWTYTVDKRLRCGVIGMYVEAKAAEVVLVPPNKNSRPNVDGVPQEQVWELQTQRPGSGVLDVECLHKGPTLVVRITDRTKRNVVPHAPLRRATPSLPEPGRKPPWAFEINVSLRSGIGISLINGQREELIYARFHGIALHANRYEETYQLTTSVEVIQIDNQLLFADRWQVLFCQQNALSGESTPTDRYIVRPALKLEMNCTPFKHYVSFDCFRLKLCDMSVQLDETLLWKLVQFAQETGAADSMRPSALLRPPNIELERPDPAKAHRCHFGTLDLEMGDVALSVVTVAKSGLSPDLLKLRQQFNIQLVSFENAMISLPPFRQFRYFETFSFLIETLTKFYMEVLKSQTLNIIVTMDAFGNPSGLASDLKDSFEGLVFEGDLSAFVGGLGYGITNSISKVASSMAHGVGTLTFDEQHELMRRRMLHCQPQNDNNSPLTHLYSGLKGLGVGVFGGLTAIVTSTVKEGKRDGFTGVLRGMTTGAVGTVTKPVQGIFDLVEGTASAMKEFVGGPPARKSHFSEARVRLPRVCSNLQSLLQCYSEDLAAAQMALLRINGFSTSEVLLDLEKLLDQPTAEGRVRQHALICSEQCYIIRQVENEPSNVTQWVPYKYLRRMQPVPVAEGRTVFTLTPIEITLEYSNERRQILPHLWCDRVDTAKRLCEKVMRAKQLYDDSKRTLSVIED